MDILHAQGYGVVCLMSGNFVQRGHPAIFDKMRRAEAAVRCGADLVLELPIQYALSSAEGFAAGGVKVLSKICDSLCFGAETADIHVLMGAAKALLCPAFSEKLRFHLDRGLSFPAARASALQELGVDKTLVEMPNNILAIEYCKAILSQNSGSAPLPIHRQGSYHAMAPDPENPSATALRNLIESGRDWLSYIPREAREVFSDAPAHTLAPGEKAILARLRTMRDGEFEALPYGSEGLWRKFMHACRKYATLEEIVAATKSKRYTRTRIDRMVMCAFLGLTAADLEAPAPYCRVLAFNETGRSILSNVKDSGFFINIGKDTRHPYQQTEYRTTALYGLFCQSPEPPAQEAAYRVYYHN